MIHLFDWAFRNGAGEATRLNYVTLPAAVQEQVRASWGKVAGVPALGR